MEMEIGRVSIRREPRLEYTTGRFRAFKISIKRRAGHGAFTVSQSRNHFTYSPWISEGTG
jgi:hypothetical protein